MMKKILLAFFLLIGAISVQAQEIRWVTLDEALAKQKKNPKIIFMNVYTDWYAPCKMLDKETFQDAEVIDYINKNYYAVKFNAEGNSAVIFKGSNFSNPGFDPNRKGRNSAHELTTFLKVQGYPSIYIIDKNGDTQQRIVGYKTNEELLKILR
ncbi:Thioredoxin family protein [Flavobacterium psychrophilum]|uniref:thioredoxin family protein n=1 Tax=Flavobacterium psychrophilum TaxID=96345 RepID=UPI000B7C119E|nr:thioredoxin fold domain-containing protein [Flavobacterium psychrophilum]SNA70355.1 Thioredoxin family protein [Flavobacterium psychrophilum]